MDSTQEGAIGQLVVRGRLTPVEYALGDPFASFIAVEAVSVGGPRTRRADAVGHIAENLPTLRPNIRETGVGASVSIGDGHVGAAVQRSREDLRDERHR